MRTFYKKRAIRLIRPTIFLLVIWILIIALLIFLLPDWQICQTALIATVIPLWFLVVYLFVISIPPLMLKLHKKYKTMVPAMLMVLTAGVDFIRFKFGRDLTIHRFLNVGLQEVD